MADVEFFAGDLLIDCKIAALAETTATVEPSIKPVDSSRLADGSSQRTGQAHGFSLYANLIQVAESGRLTRTSTGTTGSRIGFRKAKLSEAHPDAGDSADSRLS